MVHHLPYYSYLASPYLTIIPCYPLCLTIIPCYPRTLLYRPCYTPTLLYLPYCPPTLLYIPCYPSCLTIHTLLSLLPYYTYLLNPPTLLYILHTLLSPPLPSYILHTLLSPLPLLYIRTLQSPYLTIIHCFPPTLLYSIHCFPPTLLYSIYIPWFVLPSVFHAGNRILSRLFHLSIKLSFNKLTFLHKLVMII